MATFWPDGLCIAELLDGRRRYDQSTCAMQRWFAGLGRNENEGGKRAYQTTP